MKTTALVVGSVLWVDIALQQKGTARVKLRENAHVVNWPTVDFMVRGSVLDTGVFALKAGELTIIEAVQNTPQYMTNWQVNQVVGQIKTVAGISTFDQEEEP